MQVNGESENRTPLSVSAEKRNIKMSVLQNFIVFEGIDGAGTTTQLKKLESFFQDRNATPAHFDAEPTTGETGRFLRRVLKGEVPATPETQAYLFAADRNEHIFGKSGIAEFSEGGTLCFSDRYFFSSLAYQSAACGMELPLLLNSRFPLPRILFYFDIDPEISLKRVTGRGEQLEIFEKLDYQQKTRAKYEEVMTMYDGTELGEGMKVVRIDATKTPDEIHSQILSIIKDVYGL